MGLDLGDVASVAVAAAVYALTGVVVFALAFWVLSASLPFSLTRGLGAERNPAVAAVVAGLAIALSLVIAASVQG